MTAAAVDATLEAAIRRDRVAVAAALAAVIALSWTYLLAGAGMGMPALEMTRILFAAINRQQRHAGQPYVATSIFAMGYLAAWAGFSLVAVILQWGLQRAGSFHRCSSPPTRSSAASCCLPQASTN